MQKVVYFPDGTERAVEFLGDSLAALRAFPSEARRAAGYQIHRVQTGGNPTDWKPMPSIGAGVREIRIHESAGAFRVIYVARLADAVFVLHCFQKKSAKTARGDLELARSRYERLIAGRASR